MITFTATAAPERPYRIERVRLVERAMTLRLAALVADSYRDPERMVARAAAASRYLVTVDHGGPIIAFLFARADTLASHRAACVTMIGIAPAHRTNTTALTLLRASDELFDDTVTLTWTTTAHPTLVCSWAQHFTKRMVSEIDPSLATELWSMLGAAPAFGDVSLCRGRFIDERAARAELAGKRDRRLLVARRR